MHDAGYGLPRTPIFRKVAFLCPRTVGGVKRRIYFPMGGGPREMGGAQSIARFLVFGGMGKEGQKGHGNAAGGPNF